MNAASMNTVNVTAKIENSKEVRPPGGFPLASAPEKIFICSPYRPTAKDPPCRKAQLEANIQRAKTACRILSTMGIMPLAPHLYFTQFLKDGDAQERSNGIRFGMQWLEEADEVWVFGETISEGMAEEIERAYELKKPIRNLPEPGRMVELLLKRLSEQYHIPMEDKTEEQHEAAESEEHNGKQE